MQKGQIVGVLGAQGEQRSGTRSRLKQVASKASQGGGVSENPAGVFLVAQPLRPPPVLAGRSAQGREQRVPGPLLPTGDPLPGWLPKDAGP